MIFLIGDNLPYGIPRQQETEPDILGYDIGTNGSVTVYRKGDEQENISLEDLRKIDPKTYDVALFLQGGFGKK